MSRNPRSTGPADRAPTGIRKAPIETGSPGAASLHIRELGLKDLADHGKAAVGRNKPGAAESGPGNRRAPVHNPEVTSWPKEIKFICLHCAGTKQRCCRIFFGITLVWWIS